MFFYISTGSNIAEFIVMAASGSRIAQSEEVGNVYSGQIIARTR